jgi:chromosome segregation ATPase
MNLTLIGIIAAVLAFGGLFADVKYQEVKVSQAQADTATAQAALTVSRANVSTLQSANADCQRTIGDQNSAIKQLQAVARERTAAAAAAEARAARADAARRAHEADLAKQQPSVPGDPCKSACAALAQPL